MSPAFAAISLILANPVLDARDDVKAALGAYTEAVRTFDVAALDKVLSPDYLEVSPLGEVDPREKVLSFYRVSPDQRGPVPTAISLEDMHIRMIGKGTAVAVFQETITLDRSGKPFALNFRVTSILVKKGRTWLIFSNHVNGLRKVSTPAK